MAALIALALLGGYSLARGGALFSPGALSASSGGSPMGGVYSHAEIAGRCAACHAAPWERQGMAERCLACHTDLEQEPGNFHQAMLAESRTRSCYGCHSEHHGPRASLTVMDLQRFPHDTAGFSLQAHQGMAGGKALACGDCHSTGFSGFQVERCASCHLELPGAGFQAHQAAFGEECLACHDGVDRYGQAFEHGQTSFALAGKHAALACADCHAGAASMEDLKGTAQECFACHADQDSHRGEYGQDCAACHTAEGWIPASFDHSVSAFPLEGMHLSLACGQCHRSGPAGMAFEGTPGECADCHAEPAYHMGLLGADCAACHTAEGWSPARFEGRHSFPIDHGESGRSACRTCHPDRLEVYSCYGCHEHSPGEVAAEHQEEGIGDFQDCMRCHPTGQEKEGDDDS